MTAADDVNLDDLKRRARRRLVGAIVLALVVAVVVPMLLESDPKPLGEDVAVKIPPVDDGKFVSRLSDKGGAESTKGDAAKSASRMETRTEGKSEAPKAGADGAARSSREAPKVEEPRAAAPSIEDTTAASPKAESAKTESAQVEPRKGDSGKGDSGKSDSGKGSAPDAAIASASPANGSGSKPSPGIPAATPNGLFAVQVYAFSDVYGANSLVNKLKRVGYPAYSEPTNTSKGQLWRVRIGPFPSRDVAATARDRLKGEGYNGIVTTK